MTADVRFFCMKLALNILHKCLADASFGKGGEEIRRNLYGISRYLSDFKAFQDKEVIRALMHSQDTIEKLAEKLAEGDWAHFKLVINLIEELASGNVLVVEKEEYNQLANQPEIPVIGGNEGGNGN